MSLFHRAVVMPALVVSLVAALAGCSGTTAAPVMTDAKPSTAAPPQNDTTSATDGSTQACDGKDLKADMTGTSRTPATALLVFKNEGSSDCTLSGWPDVVLRAPSGEVISTGQHMDIGFTATTVLLHPDAVAYAFVQFSTPPCELLGTYGEQTASSAYVFDVTAAGGPTASIPNPDFWLCSEKKYQDVLVWQYMSTVEELDVP